jgi:hypothetical protein
VYTQEAPTAAAARASGAGPRKPGAPAPPPRRGQSQAGATPPWRRGAVGASQDGLSVSQFAGRGPHGAAGRSSSTLLGLGRLQSFSVSAVWSLIGGSVSASLGGGPGSAHGGSIGGGAADEGASLLAGPGALRSAAAAGGALQSAPKPAAPQEEGDQGQQLAPRRAAPRTSQGKGTSAISFSVHGPTGRAALTPGPRAPLVRTPAAAADAGGASAASSGACPPEPAAGSGEGLAVQRSACSGGEAPAHRLHRLARPTRTAGVSGAFGPGSETTGSGQPLGEGAERPASPQRQSPLCSPTSRSQDSCGSQTRSRPEPLGGSGRAPPSPAAAPEDPGQPRPRDPWDVWEQPALGAPRRSLQSSSSGLAFAKPEPARFPKVPNLAPEAEWDGTEEFGPVDGEGLPTG